MLLPSRKRTNCNFFIRLSLTSFTYETIVWNVMKNLIYCCNEKLTLKHWYTYGFSNFHAASSISYILAIPSWLVYREGRVSVLEVNKKPRIRPENLYHRSLPLYYVVCIRLWNRDHNLMETTLDKNNHFSCFPTN